MKSDQNKIYYDVNIPYKVEEKDPRHHFYSKAQTEIRLNGPLIPDPQNYDLAISKFKVDTESLPVFIPEMKHPEKEGDNVFLPTGEAISDYTVTAYYPKCIRPQINYMYKRYTPIEWTVINNNHKHDEEKYEYKSDKYGNYYRGKTIHPLEWTDVDVAKLPYNPEIYDYKLKNDFKKYNLKATAPLQWTPIPEGHQMNLYLYEYWNYDGHNVYRRKLYDNFTNADANPKDIPENHIYDTNIFDYFVDDADSNPEQVVLKNVYPNVFTPINSVQYEIDDDKYEYQAGLKKIREWVGLTYFPEDWTRIPEGHHENTDYFEYDKRDPYNILYKGKDFSGGVKTWRTLADGQYNPIYEGRVYITRERWEGQYHGKRPTGEKYLEFEGNIYDPENMQYEPDIYSYTATDTKEGKNNGFVYDCVSDNVTFFKNEGGPTTKDEMFVNRNPFTYTCYDGLNHPENTNEEYFQYDYQSVLDRINVCIERVLGKLTVFTDKIIPKKLLTYDQTLSQAYFVLEEDRIVLHLNREFLESNILLKFSGNLYKYIGNGFKCRFYNNPLSGIDDETHDGSFFIDYNPFAWRHAVRLQGDGKPEVGDIDQFNVVTAHDKWTEVDGGETFFTNPVDYILMDSHNTETITSYNGMERQYYLIPQQYSTLANWNVCKCILICSSSFPIKAEYYPTLTKNMTLTHYKEDWYINLMRNIYNESVYNDDQQIFDKASTKILDVYYPVSTSGGDIRSCIIYSNDNIEMGNKIDLIGGMDLENFDVKVKWVDIYGNVYDLYIAPGCSVSIRFCFTRKKILKEELLDAFDTLKRHLEIISNHYVPVVDDNGTFDLHKEPPRKKPKGGQVKVQLPGVLDNGLIIKP